MVERQKVVAFCGLNCVECEAYKATQENDMVKIARIAERWSGQGDIDYKAGDLICDGCLGDRLTKYCQKCEVRECGLEKGYRSCAQCDEYVCGKLRKEWDSWVDSDWTAVKANLDQIRRAPKSPRRGMN